MDYKSTFNLDSEKIKDMIPESSVQGMPGDGDFVQLGKHFASLFIDLAGLKKTDNILDIGCSIGRNAVPLTQYLLPTSIYEGFDVEKDGPNWCSEHITNKYPNFHFKGVELYNSVYNSKATQKASTFTFPYKDNYFNFVFLISVFTHMVAEDMENYMKEISRVTKSGGTLFATYFLFNEEQEKYKEHADRQIDFQYENYRASDPNYHEGCIGYEEKYIKKIYAQNGFADIKLFGGQWAGRPSYTSYQDIIIAKKL